MKILLSKKAYWMIGFFCVCITNTYSQDQHMADSLRTWLTQTSNIDSLYLDNLKQIAFNETDPVEAEKFADRLIDLATEESDQEFIVSGYLQKGNADRLQGNLEEALSSYFSGLEIARDIGKLRSVGALQSVIADVYSVSGNSPNARLYYNKAIATFRLLDEPRRLATALLNTGDEYFNNEVYDTALLYFQESATIFDTINYPIGTAYNLGNAGMVYASLGNNVPAEENINQAIEILEGLEDYYGISVYLTYMAEIYAEKGDLETALKYGQRSLDLARQYKLKDQISDAYLLLSGLHERSGDLQASLDEYRQHIIYKDSVTDIETVEQLANLRTDYEVSQKQTEVDLLEQQKRNQQIIVFATAFALFLIGLLALTLFRRNKFIRDTNKIIEEEKNRSESLLLNILPEETARELKGRGKVKAKQYDSVSVMFTDFKDFTQHAEQLHPDQLVESVDFYYSKFDEIIEKYGIEKIKTLGDSYMCAAGLPDPSEDHATKIVRAAIDINQFIQEVNEQNPENIAPFEIRIGINSGPVVAGVVGTKKFAYDIWGHTVNIASRMESSSEPGKINISENTYDLIKDHFTCAYRGELDLKNRVAMKMFFVEPDKVIV